MGEQERERVREKEREGKEEVVEENMVEVPPHNTRTQREIEWVNLPG